MKKRSGPLEKVEPRPFSARSRSIEIRRLVPALLLIVAVVAANAFSAQDAKFSPEKRAQLETAISKFMAANSVPGLSAAVVENGEFAWSEGFGMADVKNSVKVTPKTLFRLASSSSSIWTTWMPPPSLSI